MKKRKKNPYFYDDEDIARLEGRTENIFTLPECAHGEMVRAFHLELKPSCTSELRAPVCVRVDASYRVAGCLEDEEDHGVSEHRITLLRCQPREGYEPAIQLRNSPRFSRRWLRTISNACKMQIEHKFVLHSIKTLCS